MIQTTRAAVIGTGFIGGVHARAIRRAGGEVTAVGASSPERARAAAELLGASTAISSPEQLGDVEVDIVHVCAPNAVHAPYARAALEAGMHVVCEKPLSLDVATSRELTDLAALRSLVATVPFVYRYYAAVREARARIRAGDLGEVWVAHGSYLQDWMSRADDWSWRVDPRVGGASRALADIGSHWCDLVEFVSGHSIQRVCARTRTVIPERRAAEGRTAFSDAGAAGNMQPVKTEDVGLMLFETDRGAVGSAVISQVAAGRKNRLWFELEAEFGALAFDQERPEELWLGQRQGATILQRGPESFGAAAQSYSLLPPGHPQGYHDCFDLFVTETYSAINHGPPDGLPVFADGLRAARITEAALASAKSEDWVEVPT